MNTQIELHQVQATILRELLFKPTARFTDLNIKELTSDHFTFHITKLVEAGLVKKTDDGKYTLSTIGKEFANRLDTDIAKIERQPKIAVAIIGVRVHNGEKQYLIQKRLKQPYYGFHGVVTGKIRWGDTLFETAARELDEEAGLQAEFTLKGIKHKMDYSPTEGILEDKFFMVCIGENCTGTLKETFEGGQNMWLSREQVDNLPDQFPDLSMLFEFLNSETIIFNETKYTVEKY
ncbi:MAG: NUDIX hydrolase [bacterium]|nr:NUDIX hydrolase [bacterium]